MPTEEDQYWEQECADFEEDFCRDQVFWRTVVHALRDTPLFSVFERLCQSFPDHPHDYNTVFYLFDHVGASPEMYSVVLRCSHFEHSSLHDLRSLTDFLGFAGGIISTEPTPHLELLDGCAEILHVRFYSPRYEIVTLLKKQASRKPTRIDEKAEVRPDLGR